MTQAEWQAQVEACGGDLSQNDVINLLFADGPNAVFSDTVNQMHVTQDSLYNYLRGIFPTETLNDWSGTAEIGETYHDPFIPMDFSIFQRSMQICSPAVADECHTDYCEIPDGGISKLPEYEMWKWGFKTKPLCIANIRTNGKVRQVAKMLINGRFAVDEQVMNSFYTFAMLRMLGHKFVLEYENVDTNAQPVSSTNPYNYVQAFKYAYMQPLFPAPSNLNNIMPLDFSVLDLFGQGLAVSKNRGFIAKGPRGEPIYELIHSYDWYRNEVIDNPEFVERNKFIMSTEVLPGYRMAGVYGTSQKEIVGNFSMKQNDSLPRLAESTTGGLTIVQPFTEVPIDIGTRPMHNYREYENAPFGLAVMLGKNVGKILTRPDITTGIEGLPIQPITGNGPWIYRNDYDKVCNDDLNKPHFRKRYEMGFKAYNPDAGTGIIYRNKLLRLRPVNTCALKPIIQVTPASTDCNILSIGCNPTERATNVITESAAGMRKVQCSAAVCGDSASRIYRLTVRREGIDSINPNQEPLQGCDCGDTIQVFISDEDGVVTKVRDAVILDYYRPNVVTPHPIYVVQLASSLAAGECVTWLACKDDSPTESTVVGCKDNSDDASIPVGSVQFIMDSALPCNVGADVEIIYNDADGDPIGDPVEGTIVSFNPATFTYEISSEDETGLPGGTAAFNCSMRTGQVTVVITCA